LEEALDLSSDRILNESVVNKNIRMSEEMNVFQYCHVNAEINRK